MQPNEMGTRDQLLLAGLSSLQSRSGLPAGETMQPSTSFFNPVAEERTSCCGPAAAEGGGVGPET